MVFSHLENRLVIACEHDDPTEVRRCIDEGVNVRVLGDWAIKAAAGKGHLACIKLLVANGSDFRANNDWALRVAVNNGHLRCVEYLVSLGADVHAYDDYVLPVVFEEVRNNHLVCIDFLKKVNVRKFVERHVRKLVVIDRSSLSLALPPGLVEDLVKFV